MSKRTVQDILYELHYESRPGVHTYSMCGNCGKHFSRSYKCVVCLRAELAMHGVEEKL